MFRTRSPGLCLNVHKIGSSLTIAVSVMDRHGVN